MKKKNSSPFLPVRMVDTDRVTAFRQMLQDPSNARIKPREIAKSCGINFAQMMQVYREEIMMDAMMESTRIMAKNMCKVVETTMHRALDPEASEKDRRLALEMTGMLKEASAKNPVNVNVNQANMSHPGFEDAAKKGTVAINLVPEE